MNAKNRSKLWDDIQTVLENGNKKWGLNFGNKYYTDLSYQIREMLLYSGKYNVTKKRIKQWLILNGGTDNSHPQDFIEIIMKESRN